MRSFGWVVIPVVDEICLFKASVTSIPIKSGGNSGNSVHRFLPEALLDMCLPCLYAGGLEELSMTNLIILHVPDERCALCVNHCDFQYCRIHFGELSVYSPNDRPSDVVPDRQNVLLVSPRTDTLPGISLICKTVGTHNSTSNKL
jgi:hypothetical protein